MVMTFPGTSGPQKVTGSSKVKLLAEERVIDIVLGVYMSPFVLVA